MRKKTVYYLPGFTAPVILSALCMICSAVARIVWVCGESSLSRPFWCLQILLPLAANMTFVLILLWDGSDRLFRSAIPVWLGCVFFAAKALGFPSVVHTVLCLLLYALVAALYTATVTGCIPTQKLLWFLFGLPMLLWRTGERSDGPSMTGCRRSLCCCVWRHCSAYPLR